MHMAFQSPYPLAYRVARQVADDPDFAGVFALLREVPGAQVYLVGGAVRDAILGKVPANQHVMVGGVDEGRFDKWRKEQAGKARDFDIRRLSGRSIEDDLAKRDITINSLAYGVHDGRLVDPMHGLDDLARGYVRLNSTDGLREEPVRALRALRFGAHTGFAHEAGTWEAIRKAVPHVNDVVSDDEGHAVYAHPRSAIGQELLLGLHHHPARTFRLFTEAGATGVLLPELDANDDDSVHEMLSHLQHVSLSAKLVGLFLTLEDRLADTLDRFSLRLHLHAATHKQALLHRTRLNTLAQAVTRLHGEHPRAWSAHDRERLLTGEHADDLFALLEVKSRQAEAFHDHVAHGHAARVIADQLEPRTQEPDFLTTRDLLKLGVPKGPHTRFLLRDLRSAQLEGRVRSMNDAVQWVLRA